MNCSRVSRLFEEAESEKARLAAPGKHSGVSSTLKLGGRAGGTPIATRVYPHVNIHGIVMPKKSDCGSAAGQVNGVLAVVPVRTESKHSAILRGATDGTSSLASLCAGKGSAIPVHETQSRAKAQTMLAVLASDVRNTKPATSSFGADDDSPPKNMQRIAATAGRKPAVVVVDCGHPSSTRSAKSLPQKRPFAALSPLQTEARVVRTCCVGVGGYFSTLSRATLTLEANAVLVQWGTEGGESILATYSASKLQTCESSDLHDVDAPLPRSGSISADDIEEIYVCKNTLAFVLKKPLLELNTHLRMKTSSSGSAATTLVFLVCLSELSACAVLDRLKAYGSAMITDTEPSNRQPGNILHFGKCVPSSLRGVLNAAKAKMLAERAMTSSTAAARSTSNGRPGHDAAARTVARRSTRSGLGLLEDSDPTPLFTYPDIVALRQALGYSAAASPKAGEETESEVDSDDASVAEIVEADFKPQASKQVDHVFTPSSEPRLRTVVITRGDVERLAPGEYLNDSCIDWWCDYIFWRILHTEDLRAQCHFFSSFFYKKLAQGHDAKAAAGESRAMTAWRQVARWTRHVDIFTKKFVFVPVNFALHWSIAIICNLDELHRRLESGVDAISTQQEDVEVVSSSDETHVNSSVEEPEAKHLVADVVPCIVFLDSLKCHNQTKVCNQLREYLAHEWMARKSNNRGKDPPVRITAKLMPNVSPSVPLQDNSCDCGVFVCKYAQTWLELLGSGKLGSVESPFSGLPADMVRNSMRGVLFKKMFSCEDVKTMRSFMRSFALKLGKDAALLKSVSVPSTGHPLKEELQSTCCGAHPGHTAAVDLLDDDTDSASDAPANSRGSSQDGSKAVAGARSVIPPLYAKTRPFAASDPAPKLPTACHLSELSQHSDGPDTDIEGAPLKPLPQTSAGTAAAVSPRGELCNDTGSITSDVSFPPLGTKRARDGRDDAGSWSPVRNASKRHRKEHIDGLK